MQPAEPPVIEQAVRDANLTMDELAALGDLDEHAELLPALRTEVMADALDEAHKRLALASLLQDRVALDSLDLDESLESSLCSSEDSESLVDRELLEPSLELRV